MTGSNVRGRRDPAEPPARLSHPPIAQVRHPTRLQDQRQNGPVAEVKRWREEEVGRGRQRRGGESKWRGARPESGAGASSVGRERKHKPEGRMIYPGVDESVPVVSETDG